MDPNACLQEMLKLLPELREFYDDETAQRCDPELERFFELFESLDGWLRKGGALPETWTRTKVHVHPGSEPKGHTEMRKTRR